MLLTIFKGGLDWWSNIGNVVEDIRRLLVDREEIDVVQKPGIGNGVTCTCSVWVKGRHKVLLGRGCSTLAGGKIGTWFRIGLVCYLFIWEGSGTIFIFIYQIFPFKGFYNKVLIASRSFKVCFIVSFFSQLNEVTCFDNKKKNSDHFLYTLFSLGIRRISIVHNWRFQFLDATYGLELVGVSPAFWIWHQTQPNFK